MTNPTNPAAALFAQVVKTLRADVGSILDRLDVAAATLRTSSGVDIDTGEQLPPDPAFALGNQPPADSSGLLPNPAFARGNTAAPVVPTAPPAAAPEPESAPEPAPAPATVPIDTATGLPHAPVAALSTGKIAWLEEELAKAKAEAGA
jgi:hypothetical protein